MSLRRFTRREALLVASSTWLVPESARAEVCSPDRLDQALRDVARARSSVTTLSGPFTQERTIGLLSAKVRSTGTLTLVRPDRLRWELSPPDDVVYWIVPEACLPKQGGWRSSPGGRQRRDGARRPSHSPRRRPNPTASSLRVDGRLQWKRPGGLRGDSEGGSVGYGEEARLLPCERSRFSASCNDRRGRSGQDRDRIRNDVEERVGRPREDAAAKLNRRGKLGPG